MPLKSSSSTSAISTATAERSNHEPDLRADRNIRLRETIKNACITVDRWRRIDHEHFETHLGASRSTVGKLQDDGERRWAGKSSGGNAGCDDDAATFDGEHVCNDEQEAVRHRVHRSSAWGSPPNSVAA